MTAFLWFNGGWSFSSPQVDSDPPVWNAYIYIGCISQSHGVPRVEVRDSDFGVPDTICYTEDAPSNWMWSPGDQTWGGGNHVNMHVDITYPPTPVPPRARP